MSEKKKGFSCEDEVAKSEMAKLQWCGTIWTEKYETQCIFCNKGLFVLDCVSSRARALQPRNRYQVPTLWNKLKLRPFFVSHVVFV